MADNANDVIDAIDMRPLDRVEAAGPPAPPPNFPCPKIRNGRRHNVVAFDEYTHELIVAKNVLFRDYSGDYGVSSEQALSLVEEAYWPIPDKEIIETNMGHIEICYVLKKSSDADSTGNYLDDGSDDSSDDSYDDGDKDVVFTLTTRRVAVKVNYWRRMDDLRERHAENPIREVSAMQLIGNDNPHVMGIIETLFDGGALNVVMPYAASGDMFELLQDRDEAFPENEARYWFRQIMDGIQHLHQKGICHRDLSLENVMIDGDNAFIIDMGMAIRIPYTDANNGGVTDIVNGSEKLLIQPQGICGKLPYMSPEIYENSTAFDGGAVDIWTAGTILFRMVTGKTSYGIPHINDMKFNWMVNNLSSLIMMFGIRLSRECVDLLENMLQVKPRKRCSLEEVLNHPWLKEEQQE